MIRKNSELHIEKENKKKKCISTRKNLTLATVLALSQACNFNNDAKFGNNLTREWNKIYFYDSEYVGNWKSIKTRREIINIADPKTFQVIDWLFGKDNLHVYLLSGSDEHFKILEWADSETFEKYPWIDDTTSTEHAGHTFYRDENYLYDMWNRIDWVNPNTADLSMRWHDWTIRDGWLILKRDWQKFIKIKW